MTKQNPYGTLVSQHILERIESDGLIVNADIKQCLKPASYELRVGSYFDPGTNKDIPLDDGEGIAIAPRSFVLLGSKEMVDLPLEILGMLYLRSTYARRGFTAWFQGLVDPGYKGSLTFPLHNLTGNIIPVYGGERICHIIFERLSEAADQPYDGDYQGSKGATPASRHPTLKIVGEKLAEYGQIAAENAPRALLETIMSNPELLKRLLY
jgi:deoxycytidine triphosphate deaminase